VRRMSDRSGDLATGVSALFLQGVRA
jgi:hypothetical protein